MNDEFYIGYRETAPPMTARFVFVVAVLIVVGVWTSAAIVGGSQNPADDGTYSFGQPETFEGVVLAQPFLHVVVGADAGEDPSRTRAALLVGQGKFGAPGFVTDASDKRVRFAATRIERDGVLMLETEGAGKFEVLGDAGSARGNSGIAPRTVTLTGELVDTKCFLGVMKPGRGKVHRGCAAECLRGGVPPALLVQFASGVTQLVLLTGADADAIEIDPDWAGRVITVTGSFNDETGLPAIRVTDARLAE